MKCGFAKVDITPQVGCHLAGYPYIRISEGIADPLYIRALTFEENGLAVFLVFDVMALETATADHIRQKVAQALGCEVSQVHAAATHTHYAPYTGFESEPLCRAFSHALADNAIRAARAALADGEAAQFRFAESTLPGISFIRRYRMRDGSVRTNPGRHNPDILEPAGQADESIRLLRIVREKGDILLVGFQVHPDVRGGLQVSADYPGVLCQTLDRALPGTHAIYFNGTCGDLNHIDVNCPPWDTNKGPDHMTHMGRAIAGKILSMYTKAQPIESGAVRTAATTVTLPRRHPDARQIAWAEEYLRLHSKDNAPNTEVIFQLVEARRILSMAKCTEDPDVPVCAAVMGDVAMVTVPGEGFCRLGQALRAHSPCVATFVLNTANAYEGYFPSRDAYDMGGYEVRTSPFLPGVAEAIEEAGSRLLADLKGKKHENQ